MTRYYQKFIKNYTQIANPLEALLKKKVRWQWKLQQQLAFELLKKKINQTPMLRFFDWDKSFQVHVDASLFVIGCVLAQLEGNKIDLLIYFISRKLTEVE